MRSTASTDAVLGKFSLRVSVCEDVIMRLRLPWVIALPMAFVGSWTAHVAGRAIAAGSIEGSEATAPFERASITHGGAPVGVAAVLAPFVAIALIAAPTVRQSHCQRRGPLLP